MSKGEAVIQREVLNFLIANKWAVIRINAINLAGLKSYIAYPQLGSSGMADMIAINSERTIFIEIKTTTGQLQPSQIRFKKWCQFLGLTYRVVRSVGDVKDLSYE